MNQGVQNFSKLIEILLTLAPKKILEVGTQIGLWAEIITKHWKLTNQIETGAPDPFLIEGMDFSDEHSQNPVFSKIYTGLPEVFLMDNNDLKWELIILENTSHILDQRGFEQLLRWGIDHAPYVLLIDFCQAVSSDPESPALQSHSLAWKYQLLSIDKKWILYSSINDQSFNFLLLSKHDPKQYSTLLTTGEGNKTETTENNFSGAESAYYNALSVRNDELVKEIESIRNSRSFRFINRLKSLPLFSSYSVVINFFDRQRRRRRTNKNRQTETLRNDSGKQIAGEIIRSPNFGEPWKAPYQWTKDEKRWIEDQLADNRPLSVNQPEWRGILASSKQLFGNIYYSMDDLTPESGKRLAALFHEAGVRSVTIQGFPITYYHLIKALAKFTPEILVNLIWHGNFLHTKEDYSWESWKIVNQLYNEGLIKRIGFVKKGMAEIYRANGMDAYFIMNLVNEIPNKPSPLSSDDPQVGIWAEPDWGWKKLPYSMLASLRLIPHAKGSVFNVSPRAEEFGRQILVECKYYNDPLTHTQTIEKLGQMHINLYASLTECAPMLPLESLSVGVPCILGPTSHYFKDDPWLYSHLVVPSPDDAYEIAMSANRAIENRDEIINRYRPYAIEYNKSAREMINTFLNS